MIKTGLKTLDEEISLEPDAPTLVYLISPAGSGKTTVLTTVALNTLLAGHDVLYLTGHDATASSIVKIVQKFSTGLPVDITPGQLKVIDDPLCTSKVYELIRSSKRKNTLVIIDHFNGIVFDNSAKNPEEFFRGLRLMNVPTILGFQCTRFGGEVHREEPYPEYFRFLDHVLYLTKTRSLNSTLQTHLVSLKSRTSIFHPFSLKAELGPNGMTQVP